MKKIYLHIGLHKTATTSIQLGLYKNRFALKKLGYLYPETCMAFWGHHNIPWQLASHYMFDPKKGALGRLMKEIRCSKQDKIIISSEAFFLLGPKEITILKDFLSGYDVNIILYVRNQVDWLQSMWGEIAKGRVGVQEIENIDSWVHKKIIPRDGNDGSPPQNMGDYLLMIDLWESFFGRGKVIVKKFEDEIKGNVFESFLCCVGIKCFASLDPPDKVNESLDIVRLEFIRNMRIAMRDIGFKEGAIEELKWLVSIDKHSLVRPRSGREIYYSQHVYDEVLGRFEAINKEISVRYFDGGALFDEEKIERSFTDSKLMATPEMFELFSRVLSQVSSSKARRGGLVNPIHKFRLRLEGKSVGQIAKAILHRVEQMPHSFVRRRY